MARIKFTCAFLGVMVFANALAGTLSGSLPMSALATWGISHKSVLEGDLLRLVSGTFLSHDLDMFFRQLVFAGGVIGCYEWLCGTKRAMVMFFAIDIAGSAIVLFAILPLIAALTSATPFLLRDFDVGMSAGGFGLIGALVCLHRWRWPLSAAVLVGIVAKMLFSVDLIADSAHLLCLFIGFFAQIVTGRAVPHATSSEMRSWRGVR